MKLKSVIILSLLICSAYMCGCKDYRNDYEISKETQNGSSDVSAADYSAPLLGMCSNQAVGDEGMYYVQDNKIFYYSFNTQKSMNWCTVANCEHDNKECCGYIGDDDYLSKYLFYYNEHIYKLLKSENAAYLEQYSMDGSRHITIGKLWDKNSYVLDDNALLTAGCARIYEGKLYYLVNEDYKTVSLCSVDLNAGAKPQVICSYEEENKRVYASDFCVSKGFAAFALRFSDESESVQSIHVISLKEQKDYIFNEEVVYFGLDGSRILYPDPESPEDIISYDVVAQETKKIIDTDKENDYPSYYYSIICAGDYILLDNQIETFYGYQEQKEISRVYKIYDYNGTCIEEIPAQQYELAAFNGTIITALTTGRTIETYIYAPVNSDDGSIKTEWKKL